jgi:hypothetical protein
METVNVKKILKEEMEVDVKNFAEVLDSMCFISDIAIDILEEYMEEELGLSEEDIAKIDLNFDIIDTKCTDLNCSEGDDSSEDEEDFDSAFSKNDECCISLSFNVERNIESESNDYDTLKTFNDPTQYTFNKEQKEEFFKKINQWIEKCKEELKDILTNDDYEEF